MKLGSKYDFTINHYTNLKTLEVCQKIFFSASNFFMHIFIMSVTYLQSVEDLQWKFYEELISQSMHYQPLFTRCSRHKVAKLKAL